MKTTEAAAGRWSEILPQFDIPASVLNGKHHPCPCTGEGEDRFRFSDRNGSGSYFCACSDGEKGGMGLLMCKTGMPFVEVAKRVDEMIGNRNDEPPKPRQTYYCDLLRRKAQSAPRSRYLESRGLEMAPGLQWCNAVTYHHDNGDTAELPAMLAPIMRRGEFLTYHVTYLHGGAKAPVSAPRKILPCKPDLRGGACPLYPAAEIMGVAEGIETAIAAHILGGLPVWAALNTSLLKHFDPPPECKHLTIYADHDVNYAGQAAAYHLAHRLHGKLETVLIAMPREPGDWNDVLLRERNA